MNEEINQKLLAAHEFIWSFRLEYLFPKLTYQDLDDVINDEKHSDYLEKIYFPLIRPILEFIDSLPDTEAEVQLLPILRLARKKSDVLELKDYWVEFLRLIIDNMEWDPLEIWKETSVIKLSQNKLCYWTPSTFHQVINAEEKLELMLYLINTQYELKSFRVKAETRIGRLKETQEKASALREKLEEMKKKRAELVDVFMIKRFKSSTVSREIDLRASGNNYKKASHHMDIIKKGIYLLESDYMSRSPILLAFNEEGTELQYLANSFYLFEKDTDDESISRVKLINDDELKEYINKLQAQKIQTDELEQAIKRIKTHVINEDSCVILRSCLPFTDRSHISNEKSIMIQIKSTIDNGKDLIYSGSHNEKVKSEDEYHFIRLFTKLSEKFNSDYFDRNNDMEVDIDDPKLDSLFKNENIVVSLKMHILKEKDFVKHIIDIIKSFVMYLHKNKTIKDTKVNKTSYKILKSLSLFEYYDDVNTVAGVNIGIEWILDYFKTTSKVC